MKTRSFLRTSLVLGAFALAPLLPTSAFSAPASARVPQVARPTAAPVTKAKAQENSSYIKALPGVNGTMGTAQTLIRRFTPLRGNGPSISLVAAVHIGEKSYYKQIQQFLDKQDVVLYEGVRPSRASAKTKRTSRATKPPVGIQKKMSDALHLQFQMEGIRYNRPHFRNSDLDWDTLNSLATKAGPDTQQLLSTLKNSVSGGPGITRTEQIVDKVLTFSASTPLLATMLRQLLIRALGSPDISRSLAGKAQAKSSTPAPAKKLDFILINERNKAVLTDIKALLKTSKRTPKPIKSIAVFYGAAHMEDIEQHLVSDFGYRPGEAQWLTAIEAIH